MREGYLTSQPSRRERIDAGSARQTDVLVTAKGTMQRCAALSYAPGLHGVLRYGSISQPIGYLFGC